MLMAFALGTLHLHIYLNGRIQNETVKVRKHWRYTTVRPAPDAWPRCRATKSKTGPVLG